MKSILQVVQDLLKPYIDAQDTALSDALTNKADTSALTTLDGKAYKTDDIIDTTMADNDYIPFYDVSASAKKRILKSNLVTTSRRIRENVTSRVANLPTAISEQNLEKYGFIIGDWFVGTNYTYFIADLDTYYGGYDSYSVLATHHVGLVVKTGASSQWNTSDSTSTGYNGSVLHSYLKGTVLNNIKADMIALFGGSTGLEHLLSHQKLLTTAVSSWAWQTGQYISALSEVQVYSSRVWGIDGYQTGEACKPLQIFQRYRFNEIFGNMWFWLRDIQSASYACRAYYSGDADSGSASYSGGAVGLILFH